MTRSIGLREANQQFTQRIRDVEAGEDFVITRNGRPVARLVPMGGKTVLTAAQEAALERIFANNIEIDDGPFDRDSLHER